MKQPVFSWNVRPFFFRGTLVALRKVSRNLCLCSRCPCRRCPCRRPSRRRRTTTPRLRGLTHSTARKRGTVEDDHNNKKKHARDHASNIFGQTYGDLSLGHPKISILWVPSTRVLGGIFPYMYNI